MSAYALDDGTAHLTYSTTARGLEFMVAVWPSMAWAGAAAAPRSARAATIMPVRVAAAATRTPRSAPVTNAAAAVWNRSAPCGTPPDGRGRRAAD